MFVATSAGNTGPGASSIGSPASAPWVTTVGASLQKKSYVAEALAGGSEEPRVRGASITPETDGQLSFVDAANHGNELCDPEVAFSGDIAGKVVLCLRGGPARVEKSRAVFGGRWCRHGALQPR